MAIQIPNPGIGNGQTGDNEFVMWSKVKDNFSDKAHAASCMLGTTTGTVPLFEKIPDGVNAKYISPSYVKTGEDSYWRKWRSLTSKFGVGESTKLVAHGIDNYKIANVTVKCTASDGSIYFANDPRTARQFTCNLQGASIVIYKGANATSLDNADLVIYIDSIA